MELRLIDKWRNATIVPTNRITDPYATLHELHKSTNDEHKQAVFVADKEFMELLKAADPKLEKLNHEERVEGPTFKGIPITVL